MNNSRIIHCIFFDRQEEGQDFQFYPGRLGVRIYENISKKAWDLWKIKQTVLINEYKLNMLHTRDREILEKEMIKFLFRNKHNA
ncbi:MAG: putative Fe(2(+))-trafficking protein [Candidatus Westeberhardia cardiocondylae]|nr:putative Fe(2(+))-trafficking protein [Candidatus Westeberhardia cardiocondylae]